MVKKMFWKDYGHDLIVVIFGIIATAFYTGILSRFNKIDQRFDRVFDEIKEMRSDIHDLRLDVREIKTQQAMINDHFLPEPRKTANV